MSAARLTLRISVAACLLVLGLSVLPLSFGQTETATLSGTITDPSGAVIPGAAVHLTNVETGITASTTSNASGLYVFASLRPGHYRMVVEKAGFKQMALTDLTLNVQDTLSRNFQMQVGTTSESVTVNGDVVSINTQSAAVSTVVGHQFVENIPLNGRSFQDLVSMTPGVVTQNPNQGSGGPGTGGDFSVNGQRTESNVYMVDGVSANVAAGNGLGNLNQLAAASGSVPAGTVLGTTQSLISVDALQEFRVQSSTYSAELGGAPGGQFSLVTRSGTNEFHGTLYEYLRNNYFDANDWFNNRLGKPASALRQNDFGGTFGGPVLIPYLYHGKDKTFFFVSYEGLRLTQPQAASISQLVPDTFMRQQAPAALQPILNAFPVQNGADFGTAAAPSLAQFVQSFSIPSRIDSTSVRLDHTFSAKLSLFFRAGYTPSSQSPRGTQGGASVVTQNSVNTQTYTLGVVSQLSSKANNDLRLGYARTASTHTDGLDNFGGATPVNLASAMVAGSISGIPSFTISVAIPGAGVSVLRDFATSNRLRQWNLIETFSVVSGHHQFKGGVDYRRIVSPTNPASPQISSIYTSVQQVLSNRASSVSPSDTLKATPIFNATAVFFQDEWRVTPRLNLSLGLRWEVNPPPHGASGQDAYTLLGSLDNPSSLSLSPRGTPLWHTSWYNFAPRLGFAWTARNTPGWETVVRAGGGVFFDTNNQVATSGFTGIGFNAIANYPGAPLPVTSAQVNLTPSVTPPFTSNVNAFPSHLQRPYTLQWSAGIQQAIGDKQALTLSYVASAGRRLQGRQSLNFQALNPNFSTIIYYKTGLTSDYHSLQTQFQRTVSHGAQVLASYTWSHCIDFGSGYATLPFTRGNCDMDVRHTLQGGVSWDLPSLGGNKLVQTIVNHWGIDSRLLARTSFPVLLLGSPKTDPATGNLFFAGLNLVTNQPIYLYGSQFPGGRAINPAAFNIPSGSNVGSAPRNFARGLGDRQINMAVRREFPLRERLRLQFRAEAFNLLNHPNFGNIQASLTAANFGQAQFMLNQALGTVASQYQQGGPRSMQFALKLAF